jgi:hypothetical protein
VTERVSKVYLCIWQQGFTIPTVTEVGGLTDICRWFLTLQTHHGFSDFDFDPDFDFDFDMDMDFPKPEACICLALHFLLVSDDFRGYESGVEAPIFVQGRWWTPSDIEAIRALIAQHPAWSRWLLSRELSERFEWRTATGQLRDMAARHLLNKLAARALIELPPRRSRGGKQSLRALAGQPDLFGAAMCEPIEESLQSLRPLEFLLLGPRHPASESFVQHLDYQHYLGYGGDTGRTLRYLVRDRNGRDLACVLFGAAAWQVKARDTFIGWNAAQRRERLGVVVNNTRFLILPHVRVPHLASHVLGRLLRRLAFDWKAKYAFEPVLAETFVERGRFAGVCYRAANWQCVGRTCGRSRNDREGRLQVSIKDIYLYPLRADFRERLCS